MYDFNVIFMKTMCGKIATRAVAEILYYVAQYDVTKLILKIVVNMK